MVDIATVRRLALDLPETRDLSDEGRLEFKVAGKGLAWTYLARPAPKRPREPHIDVLAVRCDLERKAMLIAAAPERFFEDDHYRGYPAILVRLAEVDAEELAGLLSAAWTLVAPKALVKRRAAGE